MKSKNDLVIGMLGGMGTYATIHAFQQYAEIFPAEKEWDRPRLIIDNRCTMPSRVRAFLYHENIPQLLDEMTESLKGLLSLGCNKIILACNTSHLFLPEIYKRIPELKHTVVNIIDCCTSRIVENNGRNGGVVFLLASEGTIESSIYQNELEKKHISCITPGKEEYVKLRECIEAVKKNSYSDAVKNTFLELINRYPKCILGCTELPILYKKFKQEITCQRVYDPIQLALYAVKEETEDD